LILVNWNEFKIFSNQIFKSGAAKLYTIQGSLIANKKIENDNVVFDTSGFSSGIYIVSVVKGAESGFIKVMIQ